MKTRLLTLFLPGMNVDEISGRQQCSYDPEDHEDGGTGMFQSSFQSGTAQSQTSNFVREKKKKEILGQSATVSQNFFTQSQM